VRQREELLSWSEQRRYRRLRYLTNNHRSCALDKHRRQDLASQVLAKTLRRDALACSSATWTRQRPSKR